MLFFYFAALFIILQVSELVFYYLDASKRAAQSGASTAEALNKAEEQRQTQHAATLAAEQALRTESERREALEAAHKTEVRNLVDVSGILFLCTDSWSIVFKNIHYHYSSPSPYIYATATRLRNFTHLFHSLYCRWSASRVKCSDWSWSWTRSRAAVAPIQKLSYERRRRQS